MGDAIFDGAPRRDQRLADDLAAEDALASEVGGLPAEEVHFQRFEIELVDQFLERPIHQGTRSSLPVVLREVSSWCASATCARGNVFSMRSFRSPRSTAPRTAPARV